MTDAELPDDWADAKARSKGSGLGMKLIRAMLDQINAKLTVANNPGVARVAFSQLMQLLENHKLDIRLRELMIMRIGWVTGSARRRCCCRSCRPASRPMTW